MNRGIYAKAGTILVKDFGDPELQPCQVRVQTEFASVKHGTEFALLRGKSPFEGRRFDGKWRLFVPLDVDEPKSGRFLGNIAVGRVLETGSASTKFAPGTSVYGYSSAVERAVFAEDDLFALGDSVSSEDAVCLDPGVVALTALRDARVALGDSVIVFGLGAIGLLLVQMLRIAGCAHILAVDPIAKRRRLAETFGATHTFNPTQIDAAIETRRVLSAGADIAIEASGSYRALADAIRSVRMCARVVTLGYYQGRDSQLELGAEWFHNRLELICSMPHWGNPSREYPLWDEKRVIATVQRMFRGDQLSSKGILDPIVPFETAAATLLEIAESPGEAIKMGIRFP